MLKLFEHLFHGVAGSSPDYPKALVKRALERAVDATDPRVRIVSGYANSLRPAVLHAIDHVVRLVDDLPPPLPMSPTARANDPLLGIMYTSAESLQGFLSSDPGAREFVAATPLGASPITALLMAKPEQKRVFAYDTVDDKMVSDVPLTVINFEEQRLAGLAPDETATRRFLQWRAFDYLLLLALAKITQQQEQHSDLASRKKLLQTKLDILTRSSGKLLETPQLAERQRLQEKMNGVEAEMREAGAKDSTLERHLAIISEVLGSAEQQLWSESETLYIDSMHYLRPAQHPRARAVTIQRLRDVRDHEALLRLVTIPPECLARPATQKHP